MIIDRLILFLFGKGPQAGQKDAIPAAQNEPRAGMNADASKSLPRKKIKKTVKKKTTKRKTAKKPASKKTIKKRTARKKIVKKAAKKKTIKKKTIKKKTLKKKTIGKKSTKRLLKKPAKKIRKKPIRKKAVKKSAKKSARGKSAHRDIHVVYRREDKQWALRREGMTRAWSLHNTQAAAILDARQRARREKVEMIVHAKDGSIRDSDSSR